MWTILYEEVTRERLGPDAVDDGHEVYRHALTFMCIDVVYILYTVYISTLPTLIGHLVFMFSASPQETNRSNSM